MEVRQERDGAKEEKESHYFLLCSKVERPTTNDNDDAACCIDGCDENQTVAFSAVAVVDNLPHCCYHNIVTNQRTVDSLRVAEGKNTCQARDRLTYQAPKKHKLY